jgi:hypothetical protein
MPIIDPSKNSPLNLQREPELADTLKVTLRREELLTFCDDFRIPHQRSWNKTLLAESISLYLTMKPALLAERLPLPALLELRDLVKAKGPLRKVEPRSFSYLSLRGLVAFMKTEAEDDLCILPKNFGIALEPVIDTMVQRDDLKMWDKREHLFCGLLQCYGVMEGRLLMEKYKEVSGESISLEEFFCFLRCRDRLSYEIKLVGIWSGKHFFASVDVVDPKLVYEQAKRRKDLDYCPFTERELLEAGGMVSVPGSKAAKELVKELQKGSTHRESASSIFYLLVLLVKNEASTAEILEFVFGEIPSDSIKNINRIAGLIMDFQNSLPKWSLKGHSPANLFEAERKHLSPLPKEPFDFGSVNRSSDSSAESGPKVGRNDPCPCGSGKKFKKCCGKE